MNKRQDVKVIRISESLHKRVKMQAYLRGLTINQYVTKLLSKDPVVNPPDMHLAKKRK